MEGQEGTAGARQRIALRAFLAGDESAIDAAEAAGEPLEQFLDLADRVRTAGAAAASPPTRQRPDISAVIPMFNEEDNVDALLHELVPVLEAIGHYEIIFVDDGSTDRSPDVVLRARADNLNIQLVELSRNFGQQGALSAGYDYAAGRAVVVLDADLQDPPDLIPAMLDKWREGFEVVYATRQKRKEGPVFRGGAYLFYRAARRISEIDLPVDSGDFCLLDRKVVIAIRSLPESQRFLRTLRAWVGFRQTDIEYERAGRHAGHTKYSLRGRIRLAFDGFHAAGGLPLRSASYAGLIALTAATAWIAALAFGLTGGTGGGSAPTIALILLLGGIQLIAIGLCGEHLARISAEVKRRPAFVVRATHGATVDDPTIATSPG